LRDPRLAAARAARARLERTIACFDRLLAEDGERKTPVLQLRA
jgi:hypothetical protein